MTSMEACFERGWLRVRDTLECLIACFAMVMSNT